MHTIYYCTFNIEKALLSILFGQILKTFIRTGVADLFKFFYELQKSKIRQFTEADRLYSTVQYTQSRQNSHMCWGGWIRHPRTFITGWDLQQMTLE